MATDHLILRVQNLPPELFNEVYRYTFTATSGVRTITPSYKPPKLLTIDRASRKLFATSYYGGPSGFVFGRLTNYLDVVRWLRTLNASHRSMLQKITLAEEIHSLRMGRLSLAQCKAEVETHALIEFVNVSVQCTIRLPSYCNLAVRDVVHVEATYAHPEEVIRVTKTY